LRPREVSTLTYRIISNKENILGLQALTQQTKMLKVIRLNAVIEV